MEEKWNADESKTVKDALVEKVAVIGENLKIRRFEKVVAENGCIFISPCNSSSFKNSSTSEKDERLVYSCLSLRQKTSGSF